MKKVFAQYCKSGIYLQQRQNISVRGVARIFQRGVTVCQNEGTHQIVMSFSPPVVGCLLKKSSQKGGVTGTLGPPLATPLISVFKQLVFVKLTGKLQRLNNALIVSTQTFCGTPNIQLHFSWTPASIFCNAIPCSFVNRVSFVMNKPTVTERFLLDLYHKTVTNLDQNVTEDYNTS